MVIGSGHAAAQVYIGTSGAGEIKQTPAGVVRPSLQVFFHVIEVLLGNVAARVAFLQDIQRRIRSQLRRRLPYDPFDQDNDARDDHDPEQDHEQPATLKTLHPMHHSLL